eukprot:10622758-Alexandrium_andersonii.AAC.1
MIGTLSHDPELEARLRSIAQNPRMPTGWPVGALRALSFGGGRSPTTFGPSSERSTLGRVCPSP